MENEISRQEDRGAEPAEASLVSVPLIEKERVDSKMTFELKNEQGVMPEKEDSAFWVKLLGREGEAVEGKFFVSGEGKGKLLVFEPGMPGDSNKWMEGRLVPELIRQGYSIFCVRHSGTKINVDNSSNYVNCSERIERDTEDNAVIGQIVGKDEYTAEDIANEPRIAIEALQKEFKQIYLVGHSNGVACMAFSLDKLPRETTDKIRSFIGLAGFVSRYEKDKDHFDAEGRFDGEKMRKYYEYCSQFISLGDLDNNVHLEEAILDAIYKSPLPENINLVLVNSPKDEVVPVETAKQYHGFVGRGLRIIDETQNQPDFHDLKNLQPKTLIRLLNIYHPKRKHAVTVKKEK